MSKRKNYDKIIIDSVRVAARFLGGVLFLMIAMFAFNEGIPNPLTFSFRDGLTFFAFVVMLGGLILAWIREGLGGLIVLIGYGLFIIVNPDSNLFGVVSIFPVTALLFIIYWWQSKRKPEPKKQKKKSNSRNRPESR